jgi:hypothetical protein
MKKIFFTIVLFFISLTLFSQNGGQSSENPNLKIELENQLQNNIFVIKVTNKKNCPAEITLIYNGVKRKTIQNLSSDTFHIQFTQNCIVKASSNPSCAGPNYGNVELNLCSILPVKLKYLNILKINQNEFEIVFEIEEPTKLKILNIQLSRGNNKFETVQLILGSDIKPNNVIRKRIKL